MKARHIVDALCDLVKATEIKEETTWLQCYEKSIRVNFFQIKRVCTVADWYLDLNVTKNLQFSRSQRGRESSKAKSPFEDD